MVDRAARRASGTVDDVVLQQLRRDGLIGPFAVADWSARVDIGTVRSQNEDRSHGDPRGVFAVADGVGGRSGGALAADTAIAAVASGGMGMTEPGAAELLIRVRAAITSAGQLAGHDELGTTLVLLATHHHHVVIASVGDSRAYRCREGDLEQLTVDHNVLTELLASGVTLEQAAGTGLRLDALTAHLGPRSPHPLRSHIASYSVMAGDRFLLCTDGIHGQLPHEEIASIVHTGACARAVDTLLQAARRAGGRDNAAAVLVEFARRDELEPHDG